MACSEHGDTYPKDYARDGLRSARFLVDLDFAVDRIEVSSFFAGFSHSCESRGRVGMATNQGSWAIWNNCRPILELDRGSIWGASRPLGTLGFRSINLVVHQ